MTQDIVERALTSLFDVQAGLKDNTVDLNNRANREYMLRQLQIARNAFESELRHFPRTEGS